MDSTLIVMAVLVVVLMFIAIIILYMSSRKQDIVEDVKHVLEDILE